jgi:predicted MFS family arabinose efflux permease
MSDVKKPLFDSYQIFMIAILAIIQFTVILDFMVLSPLGAILMPKLHISTAQFGFVVSAYAFSAGASGLLAAGFADKFDRKKFLLFFYLGFLIGTVLCALASTYEFLLAARIITGIFGGVIGSVGFAIITDLFKFEVRGRVMGFVQMAFASSQILGLPIGLYLANKFDWHAPFWLIAMFGMVVGLVILMKMKPVSEHLLADTKHNATEHLLQNLTKRLHIRAFIGTALLATGGFMLMPFGSAFSINNLGLTMAQLPIVYFVSGLFSILTGPILGKFADQIGHFKLFFIGTIVTGILVYIYCNLGITPLWLVITINVIMFAGIMARMVSSGALISAIPQAKDRGAFMSINSSIQQISGGIASFVAGLIVHQNSTGFLENYPALGWAVIGSMLVALGLIYWLSQHINKKKNENVQYQNASI